MMGEILTLPEAAQQLGVSLSTVRQYIYVDGILQTIKIFGRRRVTRQAIEQYQAYRVRCPKWSRVK